MPRTRTKSPSLPIFLIEQKGWKEWLKRGKPHLLAWADASRFSAEPGTHCLLPDEEGVPMGVAVGVRAPIDRWALGGLPDQLAPGAYHLETPVDAATADALYLGWLLGSYRFTRYKHPTRKLPTLTPPANASVKHVEEFAAAIHQARDLINTPANDMGPAELAAAARDVAESFAAEYREIVGEDLVRQNYPAIYEVGKASSREPRLVDIRWGDKRHPKVTLVGKGVCFDSGGLDIKPSSGMRLMKKDMGGAACVLALARVVMHAGLKVRLRVLIPAVENSISGNAYRPLDIIRTRKGLHVEIGNTDAEGRIILCDALCEADGEKPDLLIDCATLTGAARTALGTDIPALFTPDDALASDLFRHSQAENDPMWRLPLWEDYRDMLKTPAADLNSAPDSGYGGAITAALYLKEFVTGTTSWAHIDMMAWNLKARPGRPAGGEAMAIRALYALIEERFSRRKSGS